MSGHKCLHRRALVANGRSHILCGLDYTAAAQQSTQSQISSSPDRKGWTYRAISGPFDSCPGTTPTGDALSVSSFALDWGVQEQPIWLSSRTTYPCCTRKQESLWGSCSGLLLQTPAGGRGEPYKSYSSHQLSFRPCSSQGTRDGQWSRLGRHAQDISLFHTGNRHT